VIIETLGDAEVMATPGILVKNHGPFAWGKNADEAVYYLRKHGKNAYYGQGGNH